jgi:hypothetical protein
VENRSEFEFHEMNDIAAIGVRESFVEVVRANCHVPGVEFGRLARARPIGAGFCCDTRADGRRAGPVDVDTSENFRGKPAISCETRRTMPAIGLPAIPQLLSGRRATFALAAAAILSLQANVASNGPPAATATASDAPASRLHVLMLGDTGHHRPEMLFKTLRGALERDGIDLDYSGSPEDLAPGTLKRYDALVFYLNTEVLPGSAETALVEWIRGGGGLVALHCASACFANSDRYAKLVGGRFQSHGTSVFRPKIINAQHPVMREYDGFESFDETYVHTNISSDIDVLQVHADGSRYEPWTWTRTEGQGRVFYTASGHDERTWNVASYQSLVRRAVQWVAGRLVDDVPAISRHVVTIPPEYRRGGESLSIPEPLPASASMRHMRLPRGFRVELFASEPDIVKPISMAFDGRGRLWVIESLDYPNTVRPEGERGLDRIKICEDTDGDGRADKFTIFAEGLNLPQSLAFAAGGVVVAMAPNIWWMADRDGDGLCDERKILYSGFHRGDTHAMVGNFMMGADGFVYATCGYSGFRVASRGKTVESGQCLFRFRADRDEFEVLTHTSNNTWGLGLNAAGEVFGSTANNSHALFCAIPDRYLEAVKGLHAAGSAEIEDHKYGHPVTTDIRQVDFNGGYTAASGFTLCNGTKFPVEYEDRAAFVCEPTLHLIHTDLLEPRGSGYVAHDGYNLMASSDPWCAPIQTVVGPDGALWFIDWYNYIVQHNPTPEFYKTGKGNAYETPLRDRNHGRIYRIVYDGPGDPAPTARTTEPSFAERRIAIATAGIETVRTALQSAPPPRESLQFLLRASELAADSATGAAIYQFMSAPEPRQDPWLPTAAVVAGARHFEGFLRRALEDDGEASTGAAPPGDSVLANGSFETLRNGKPAGWREQLYSGVAKIATAEESGGRVATISSERGADAGWIASFRVEPDTVYRLSGWIRTADLEAGSGRGALFNIHELQSPPVVTQALSGTNDWTFVETEFRSGAHRELSVNALFGGWGQSRGTAWYDRVRVEPLRPLNPSAALVASVAEHAARENPGQLFDLFVDSLGRKPRKHFDAVAGALRRAFDGKAGSFASRDSVAKLQKAIGSLDANERRAAAVLLKKSGAADATTEQIISELVAGLESKAASLSAPEQERIGALEQMAELAGPSRFAEFAMQQISAAAPPALVARIFDLISRSGDPASARTVLDHWSSLTPASRKSAIGCLLRRAAWTGQLLDAMESGAVGRGDFDLDQIQQLSNLNDPALKARASAVLAKKGGIPDPDREKIVKARMNVVSVRGDSELGHTVFQKNCMVCHKVRGEGAAVGPDLTGIHQGNKSEILISILDPNRSVESNFKQWAVWKKSGELLSGLLAGETPSGFELVDTQGKRHVVLRSDVQDMQMQPISLMPSGFEQLPDFELASLLEFLAPAAGQK